MSVEVLRGSGYDQACDWWSCGVIAYEMLYGYPFVLLPYTYLNHAELLDVG
jgi:serine/threonine protein kinase